MIYLDHASTTYVYPEVIDSIRNTMEKTWGNPSNLYKFGQDAKKIINTARRSIARTIGADPSEIFFTSGASEGNAWVAHQIAKTGSLLCSPYEHHNLINNPKSVIIDENYLDMALEAQRKELSLNFSRYTLENNICSFMYVNNETGEIFPIERICEKAHQLGMLFHSDMTQALGHIPINVKNLKVDYATFTGHKIHAPKGVGFVYFNSDTIKEIKPLIYGGGQEFNHRAGTENVPYIEGMRLAIVNTASRREIYQHHCSTLKKRADSLFRELLPEDKFMVITPGNSVDNIYTICLKDVSNEIISDELSKLDIYIGTGSACSSGEMENSTVLTALGIPEEFIQGELRFSFDVKNTLGDVEKAVQNIVKIYKSLVGE